MKIIAALGAIACLLFCVGCGSSKSTPSQPVTPTLQSISVTPSTSTLWVALNTQQFKATGNYSDGSTKDLTSTAQWSASSPNIVMVDKNGLATPVSAGSATIWAASGTVSGTGAVAVVGLSGAYITPSGPTLSLTGSPSSAQLAATGMWTDGKTQDISSLMTWTSSDTTIAGVSSSGLVMRGTNAGYATVSGTWNNYTLTTAVSVSTQAMSNSDFDGTYVFLMNGVDTSGPVFHTGLFTADGNGNVAGQVTSESKGGIISTPSAFTGSYSVMPDGRGDMTWVLPSPLATTPLRFVLMSGGDQGRMILFDPSKPTATMGAFQKQTGTPFTTASLQGNYVFKLGGADSANKPQTIVGVLAADGAGHVLSGTADWNDNGTVNNGNGRATPLAVSGSYVIYNDGHGSMTVNLGGTPLHFAMFVVSNGLFRLLCTDPGQKLLGQFEQQTAPNGGFTTMDGSYTMLLENGGRPGVFGMTGGLLLAPPMSGWATRTTLMTLEDLEMDPPTKTMGPDGRGTIDVTFYGRTYNQYNNYSFAVYMVSPTRMYWIETDNQTVYAGLLQGAGSGQLGGTYVYMGGGLTVASGSEGSTLALLDATATSGNGGTFDGIVDVNLPTNLSPVVTRMFGSTAGSGTYSADSNSIYVKWLATFATGQTFTFYVNSSGQAVMVGQTAVSDNPVLDGWMSLQ